MGGLSANKIGGESIGIDYSVVIRYNDPEPNESGLSVLT